MEVVVHAPIPTDDWTLADLDRRMRQGRELCSQTLDWRREVPQPFVWRTSFEKILAKSAVTRRLWAPTSPSGVAAAP